MEIRILIQESEEFGVAERLFGSNKSFSNKKIRILSELVARLQAHR